MTLSIVIHSLVQIQRNSHLTGGPLTAVYSSVSLTFSIKSIIPFNHDLIYWLQDMVYGSYRNKICCYEFTPLVFRCSHRPQDFGPFNQLFINCVFNDLIRCIYLWLQDQVHSSYRNSPICCHDFTPSLSITGFVIFRSDVVIFRSDASTDPLILPDTGPFHCFLSFSLISVRMTLQV